MKLLKYVITGFTEFFSCIAPIIIHEEGIFWVKMSNVMKTHMYMLFILIIQSTAQSAYIYKDWDMTDESLVGFIRQNKEMILISTDSWAYDKCHHPSCYCTYWSYVLTFCLHTSSHYLWTYVTEQLLIVHLTGTRQATLDLFQNAPLPRCTRFPAK